MNPAVSLEQVREWALVLDAEGIPYEITRVPEGGWTLVVAPGDVERTAEALHAYQAENVAAIEAATTAAERASVPGSVPGARYTGLLVSALLAAFFLVTGPRLGDALGFPPGAAGWPGLADARWFERGAADAGAMIEGEVWRSVTALTLHAGGGHILANAVVGALFFGAVCAVFGPGVGLWLILVSGAGGNLINAWLRGPGYSGVGASTAVFGAVGILAGSQLARYRRPGLGRGRALVPVLAGLGLVLLLGANPETDVLAHAFGFLAGVGLGAAARLALRRPLGRWLQWSLAAGALGAVVACWALALA
jgi:membrane associated rhomboid family serine protease